METSIIKIIIVGLVSLIIAIILKQYKSEFNVFIPIISGVIIILLLQNNIKEIIELIYEFSGNAKINASFIKILIKITGIAILTEYAVSICKDSGENAIASKIDFGGKIIIMTLSIPIISSLIETLIEILP